MNPNQPNKPSGIIQPSVSPNSQQYAQPPKQQGDIKKVLKIVGIIILGLIILGIAWVLLGLARDVPSDSNDKPSHSSSNKTTTSTASQYVDSQGRFKITPPAGWKTLSPQTGDLADFQSENADSIGVKPYINVVSMSAQSTTLSQLVGAVKTSTARQVQNYKDLDSQAKTISGLPAQLITYSLSAQGHDLTNAQLIVIKNDGTVYSVTGASSSASWAQNKDNIQQSLLSLQL